MRPFGAVFVSIFRSWRPCRTTNPDQGFIMSLKETITNDMKAAMKAGDSQKLGTIRMLLAAMKQRGRRAHHADRR